MEQQSTTAVTPFTPAAYVSMARSRGADAVQAAAAAGAPASVVTAPASARIAGDTVVAREGEITYSTKDYTPVLDMKGLCAVRPGAREPIRSLRLFLMPDGKCVHVSNCPRQLIVLEGASWAAVEFPCWVVFAPYTKRKDELAVCACDYRRSNPNMDMMTVESVMLPLRVRHNVYRQEVRVTCIKDAAGFRPLASAIDEVGAVSPWSENFYLYKELGISCYKDIVPKFIAGPLRPRIELIFTIAGNYAEQEAEEASIQDKTMADKVLVEGKGRLQFLKDKMLKLPLESYDEPLEIRVKSFNPLTGMPVLKTPEREQLSIGTAPRIPRTEMRRSLNMDLVNDDDDQPVPVPVAAPAAAEEKDHDGFADVTEVDKDVNVAFAPSAAPNITNGKQPAQRATRRAAAASRSTDPAPAPAPAAAAPAAAAAINLNKRTGEPYKRGPYNQHKAAKCVSNRVAEAAANLVNASAASTAAPTAPLPPPRDHLKIQKLEQEVAELRQEVAMLKTEKAALAGEFNLERKAAELRVQAASAETAKEYMLNMHKQFVEGLRTGYSMAGSMASSACMPSPQAFSNGPPSARMHSMSSSHAEESGSSNASRMEDERMPFGRGFPPYPPYHP